MWLEEDFFYFIFFFVSTVDRRLQTLDSRKYKSRQNFLYRKDWWYRSYVWEVSPRVRNDPYWIGFFLFCGKASKLVNLFQIFCNLLRVSINTTWRFSTFCFLVSLVKLGRNSLWTCLPNYIYFWSLWVQFHVIWKYEEVIKLFDSESPGIIFPKHSQYHWKVINKSQIPLGTNPKNTIFAFSWPENPSN